MKHPSKTLRLAADAGATHISEADAVAFFGADAVKAGVIRFEIESAGPWQITRSIRGHAVTSETQAVAFSDYPRVTHYTFHGLRTMTNVSQPGTWSEGRVSLSGVSRSAFTSDILLQLPAGPAGESRFLNVAVLHCRDDKGGLQRAPDAEQFNLDDENEVSDFVTKYGNLRGIALANALKISGRGARRAADLLRGYALNKQTAIQLRRAGNVAEAMTYERICDSIHTRFPQSLKW